jgi:hypothetical protein
MIVPVANATQRVQTEPGPLCAEIDADGNCVIYDVSIIDLLAYRGFLKGKHVRVIGYLHLEFEGNGLYLSEEDYKHRITKNGLWINIDSRMKDREGEYNNRYVLIEGVFNPMKFGHGGMYSGVIEQISRLEGWR